MKTAIVSLAMAIARVAAQTGYPTAAANMTTVTSYTTSTVYRTSVYTVTDCATTVTYCPGSVVTETISMYTTVCPVTSTAAPTVPVVAVETPKPVPYTTSTVKTTIMYTITDCPPTQTDCPVGLETSTVSSYTTVCPVAEATSEAISPPYQTPEKETLIQPYSTGSPSGRPTLPKGNVTVPTVPRVSTTSNAVLHRSDVVLMSLSLAAAAAVALLESWL